MIEGNEGQIIASLLNLQQFYNSLYDLKFKGKKNLEELANSLYERELMIKNIRSSALQIESNIFAQAIANCNGWIGQQMAKFQMNIIQPYVLICQKISLNTNYLSSFSIRENNSKGITQGSLQFLLVEMIQLGNVIGGAYMKQIALITRHWSGIGQELLQKSKQSQRLKELILHIGFETELDSQTCDYWKAKLFVLSNQRYNIKKK